MNAHEAARHAVLRNFPHCEAFDDAAFTGCLHERARWDEHEYWLLDAALYALADDGPALERDLVWPVLRIFSYVMGALQAHADPADGYVIEDFDGDALHEWRERLQLVVEGFFCGRMPQNAHFDRVNPLLG